MEGSQTLETFDIHAPDAREGAECLWQRMREMPGLYRSERYGGFYVASRFEDVMTVLTKPAIFASGKGITLPPPTAIRSLHIPAEVDPPQHGQYRALLMPFVTAEQSRQREPAVRTIARQLIGRIPDKEPVDFVRALGRPLPILVALDLLGMPAEDARDLEQLVEDIHQDVASGTSSGAADRLRIYAERVLERRRVTARDPGEDLVSSVLLGTIAGRSLEPEEQMSMIRLFLIGGFDTVSATLSEMTYWLAQNPDEAQRLRDDPSKIASAVEELVRYTSPATYLRREVMEDVELGGTQLKKGDSVLVAFGAANRDSQKFSCPENIVPDRKPNVHVGFGAGHHRCIGSFIAKVQLQVAFEEIFAQFSGFRVDERRPVKYSSGLNQGIISLPMIFTRAKVESFATTI